MSSSSAQSHDPDVERMRFDRSESIQAGDTKSTKPPSGSMTSSADLSSNNACIMPQTRACVSGFRPVVECGPLPFLIKRDGTWLYRGSPIGRKEMVCLFASVLRREADGSYWLQTPAERGQIEVEDVPFLAVELDWGGCGCQQQLTFRTNVDEVVTAGPKHRIRVAHDLLTCEPTPYLSVRPGVTADAPWIEARISRAVYYELVALAVPRTIQGRSMLGVWSNSVFFPLGEMPAACHDN
jgi:hypothetical protein